MPEGSSAIVYTPKDTTLTIQGKRMFDWARATVSWDNPRTTAGTTSLSGGHLHVRASDAWGTIEVEFTQRATDELKFADGLIGVDPFSVVLVDKSGTARTATLSDSLLRNAPGMERADSDSNHTCSFGGLLSTGGGGFG